MKLCLLAVACFFGLAAVAHGVTIDPRLDAVASKIAGRPVHVWCYAEGERGGPEDLDAWGYVDREASANVEHMANEVCAGALALLNHDPSVAAWEEALGALVLTHESYHLRLSLPDRLNEAHTECRAVRHVAYTVEFLGGTPDMLPMLMPYALADHWHIASDPNSMYHDATCVVPVWAGWPAGA